VSPVDEFVERWLATAAHYAGLPERDRDALVRRILEDGLPPEPPRPAAPSDEERDALERHLVRASGLFDAFGYFWHNPDLAWHLCGHDEELRHFIDKGWKELRNPHPGFDLWFYWSEYLDAETEAVNPLVHFLAEGRRRGHATLPAVESVPPPEAPEPGWRPRRACLFAAFDVDGVVDPTALAYVAELSRFADVYYLADCEMAPDELAKLEPYTRGRWAIRHGRYDFGSYSMLAKDLVGWDVLDGYDEVLFANDSCYLVQPLDQVFDRMDARACDWWGLQATYERFGVHQYRELGRPLSLEEMEQAMRDLALWRYSDFIHVGSYFLAFRKRVLSDPRFRSRLDQVARQSDKTQIILKYEIGFSRLLILAGYQVSTYVDGVLPYHPVYRESAFGLLRDGFPLLKRQFLYQNPFQRPDLRRWKDRVLAVVPDADVDTMERNLRRVAPFWSLQRSFDIRTDETGRIVLPEPPGPDTFAGEEKSVPRHPHWWVFTVDPRTGVLGGAARAVFEAVRHDGGVKKIVLHGQRKPRLGPGRNIVTALGESAEGQSYALRATALFVTVGPRADLNHPLSPAYRRFIMLGDPAAVALPDPPLDVAAQHDVDLTRVVVVESPEARERVATLYPHVPEDALWLTGNPRHDLLVQPEHRLAETMRTQLAELREALDGRPLVLVSPRGDDVADRDRARASSVELSAGLGADAVVGLRPAPGARTAGEPALPEGVLDLSAERFPDVEVLWRLARVVVTDAPVDLHDLAVAGAATVDPGCADLAAEVRRLLTAPAPEPVWGSLVDGAAAQRVVRQLKRTYLPIDEWVAEAQQAVSR
jgi:hypothetical protein